jgi:hypothetical protein
MTDSRPRTEPTERHALPVVVTAHEEQSEGWLTRLKRMLFGWRAASTRADLELVLTAEQAQSDFSPEEAAMLKTLRSANLSKFSKSPRIRGWLYTTTRSTIRREWSISAT